MNSITFSWKLKPRKKCHVEEDTPGMLLYKEKVYLRRRGLNRPKSYENLILASLR